VLTACGIMHPRCCLQVTSSVRNYRPKHIELIEVISKIIIVAFSWLFISIALYYSFMHHVFLSETDHLQVSHYKKS